MWTLHPSNIVNQLSTKVSVIVIARNEAKHIASCLQSIATNEYPNELFEIILMDDHSEDGTVEIAESLGIANLRIFSLEGFDLSKFPNAFKKAAQHYAIQLAEHENILQTDADCICPNQWIQSMLEALETNDLVTGPIHISGTGSRISSWQTFENIGTMVSTAAGISSKMWFSANAANMAYRKSLFTEYFKTASVTRASGDDIYLINWAARNSKKLSFNKSRNAIVLTKAEETIEDLIRQRKRWASKTTGYKQNGIKFLMSIVFFYHFIMILSVPYFAQFGLSGIYSFGIIFFLKWIADLTLLKTCSPFFNVSYPILLSPVFSAMHAFYIALIGTIGLFTTKYSWKGRTVS